MKNKNKFNILFATIACTTVTENLFLDFKHNTKGTIKRINLAC